MKLKINAARWIAAWQSCWLSPLRVGVRSASLMWPESGGQSPASWSQLAALLALSVGLRLAADLVAVGWHGDFSADGLPGVLFPLPVLALAAWTLARLAGRPERTLDLLVTLFSLALIVDLVTIALIRLVDAGALSGLPGPLRHFSGYVSTIWLVLAATLAAIRLLHLPARRWLSAGLLAAVLVGAPLLVVYRDNTLWQAAADPEAQAARRSRFNALVSEDAFYLQPQLLERQLAALQPGHKGHIDLYFIAAAGDASQDVFMREAQSVVALFDQRFATVGRSLTLVNNARAVSDSPIASGTSLRLALKRVGAVMDRDEDVLFLYLTSHGSRDHRFYLNFWPLKFNPLDPETLRQMLDDAGIKRRVIVVSACYSGAYVDTLENENSLVISSAAADRTSFGCSNEADFTYFGKAYFDEALRQTDSFIEAFDIAAPRIAERERQNDYEPSGPRISIGTAIRPVLAEFAAMRRQSR